MTDNPETPRQENDPTAGGEVGVGPGKEEDVDFGRDKGPEEADTPGEPNITPAAGGYEGRDPKTDMPRVPSVPETQDDPKSHDAAPPEDKEPPASN